jgi:hypothetical protein
MERRGTSRSCPKAYYETLGGAYERHTRRSGSAKHSDATPEGAAGHRRAAAAGQPRQSIPVEAWHAEPRRGLTFCVHSQCRRSIIFAVFVVIALPNAQLGAERDGALAPEFGEQ